MPGGEVLLQRGGGVDDVDGAAGAGRAVIAEERGEHVLEEQLEGERVYGGGEGRVGVQAGDAEGLAGRLVELPGDEGQAGAGLSRGVGLQEQELEALAEHQGPDEAMGAGTGVGLRGTFGGGDPCQAVPSRWRSRRIAAATPGIWRTAGWRSNQCSWFW